MSSRSSRSDVSGGGMTMTLPFTFRSAGVVRDELRDWLTAAGRDADVVDSARLVVTELVGNAVQHASALDPGVMVVSWDERTGDLDLSVTDGGGAMQPTQRDASTEDIGGRGLAIVDALSSRWWVEREHSRKTVHAVLALT